MYLLRTRFEHRLTKLQKCLAQETGVSKLSARRATQAQKLRPYKTTVIPALQQHDTASNLIFAPGVCLLRRNSLTSCTVTSTNYCTCKL
jgi:hypothetical protein